MKHKTVNVEQYFDNTQNYLGYRVGIDIRRLVVKQMVGDINHRQILDIGCGDGSILLPFAGRCNRLCFLDVSSKMLEIAQRNLAGSVDCSISFLQGDFEQIAIDDRFDFIICVGVLAHVTSVEKTIAKIATLLKMNGHCIIQFTDQSTLVGKVYRFYDNMQARLTQKRKYSLNYLHIQQVYGLASKYELNPVDIKRYPMMPGMARLPQRVAYKLLINALEKPWGSEVILMLEKSPCSPV